MDLPVTFDFQETFSSILKNLGVYGNIKKMLLVKHENFININKQKSKINIDLNNDSKHTD